MAKLTDFPWNEVLLRALHIQAYDIDIDVMPMNNETPRMYRLRISDWDRFHIDMRDGLSEHEVRSLVINRADFEHDEDGRLAGELFMEGRSKRVRLTFGGAKYSFDEIKYD